MVTASKVVIETKRAVLRIPTEADAVAFAEYRRRNRESHGWTEPSRTDEYFSVEFWKGVLSRSRQLASDDASYRFAAFDRKEEGRLIGMVNLNNVTRAAVQTALLGYSIDIHSMGKGLATEIVSAACTWAFEKINLKRIEAGVLPENLASVRVLLKTRFEYVGRMHQSLQIQGVWKDHDLYDKINPSWVSNF